MGGNDAVALANELGDFGRVGGEDRRQPAIDQIGRLRHLDIEPREQGDRPFGVEPGVVHDPLVDGEEANEPAMGIDADGRQVMDRTVRPFRAQEAMEVAVLGVTLSDRMQW